MTLYRYHSQGQGNVRKFILHFPYFHMILKQSGEFQYSLSLIVLLLSRQWGGGGSDPCPNPGGEQKISSEVFLDEWTKFYKAPRQHSFPARIGIQKTVRQNKESSLQKECVNIVLSIHVAYPRQFNSTLL